LRQKGTGVVKLAQLTIRSRRLAIAAIFDLGLLAKLGYKESSFAGPQAP
jgi:hypothetical protein